MKEATKATQLTNNDQQSAARSTTQKASLKKRIAFRVGAILIGLLPLLVFEIFLGAIGWKQLDGVKDPFVGFSSSRPLFELSQDRTSYEISESRKPLFCAESFTAVKSPDEFRIFCVGGSTVQGRPFAIETSFSTWLELSLQATNESKQYNVVNCGGVSYASYRLAPIVEEILDYEPDLIVLYTGHNEFLEDRTYESVKSTSPLVLTVHQKLSKLKTYSFLRSLTITDQRTQERSDILPEEVEARLDFRDGLEKYTRDEAWKSSVVSHFNHNLNRMVLAAKSADIPLMICNPVSNLRDASPLKSQNGDELSSSDSPSRSSSDSSSKLNQFQSEYQRLIDSDSPVSIDELKTLVEIDPYHAELQYRIGQAYQLAGDFENAKRHLIQAKEQDICPLRIIEPMYDVIDSVVDQHNIPLIDVKALFESKSKDGIPGRELLVDHIHPSMRGHQLIAELIVEEMEKRNWIEVGEGFEARRNESFDSHFQSLPHLYFQLGKDRLAGLKRWAEGKVTRETPQGSKAISPSDSSSPSVSQQ